MNYQEILKQLPRLPGVYLFKDAAHHILYIGKAKVLRTRVASYFKKQELDWKVSALLRECAFLEHIVTRTEEEAEVLEAKLIQEYKPKYNVLLKEGNPFLYLLLTKDEIPEIKLVRHKKEKGIYFGPFINKKAARQCHTYLVRTFQLSRCAGTVPGGCLNYHLGICAGNCRGNWSKEAYLGNVELAKQALSENYDAFARTAQQQIERYNAQWEFEKARHIAEQMHDWQKIFSTLKSKFRNHSYIPEIAQAVSPAPTFHDYETASRDLQKLLGLSSPPRTIDCFDISHVQGRNIVGSCVRFTDGKPDKTAYRRFKVHLVDQNDYAALQEIVQRRYKADPLPDLIIIDGGKGQLNAVRVVLPEAPLVSLAKREERLYGAAIPEGTVLDVSTPVGKLIIKIRDYAHHSAISYHRLLRKRIA